MKNIVIAGNGGFVKEVKWLVDRINVSNPIWNFLGFIDDCIDDSNVIGNDDYIINYSDELYVAIAIGTSSIRKIIFEKYKTNPNIRFANQVDSSVIMFNQVSLGEGNIICAGTIVTVDIIMGNCNIINLDCTIGHDDVIEDFVTINPSVNVSGNVKLCTGCNIGTGTQIIQGLQVGDGSIVGAGAVVNRDIPDNCTAVGIPAKVIKINNG